MWYIFSINETILIHYYQIKSIVYIRVQSLCNSIDFEKYIMTYTYHFCIIQNIFTALKSTCAPLIYLPFSQVSANLIDLITICIVLPFPEYYIVETKDQL